MAEFLRSARSRLTPQEAGLDDPGASAEDLAARAFVRMVPWAASKVRVLYSPLPLGEIRALSEQPLDQAVFRPETGAWYILRSGNGTVQSTAFGAMNDSPAVGDYDGDGRDDIGVFRRSNGNWYYINSSTGAVGGTAFGAVGDISVPTFDVP